MDVPQGVLAPGLFQNPVALLVAQEPGDLGFRGPGGAAVSRFRPRYGAEAATPSSRARALSLCHTGV